MKETVYSDTTGRTYCPSDCLRLCNLKQLCFYMTKGVEILDIYPSKDFKTGEDIIVYVVNKKESQKAYKEWQESKNNNV